MSIGFNVHGQASGVSDVKKLIQWGIDAQPRWMLFMDNMGMAADFKRAVPRCNVISRDYTPDGAWFNHTPREYLNWLKNRMSGSDVTLWGYVDNEAGTNPAWYSEMIRLNGAEYHLPIVFGNWSVGTPARVSEYGAADMREMLTLAAQNRNYIALGIHEYGHATLLSGFQDKHYWLDPSVAPARVEAAKNNYHCGRYKFIEDLYPGLPLRIVVTEHGWDTLGDMTWWFPKSGGIIGAYRNWQVLYGGQVNREEVALKQLKYANDVIYKYGKKAEGQLLYSYGHVDARWADYDLQYMGDTFMAGIAGINKAEEYVVVKPPEPPPVIPPEPPKPPVPPPVVDKSKAILADLQSIIDKYK